MSWADAYCGPGAVPASLWSDWNLDPPLLLALALAFGAWLLTMRRTAYWRRRNLAFPAAWLVLVLAFVSPLCALSAALFSARIVHHLLLVGLAAPLLALALPRVARLLALPLTAAAVLHAVLFWFWHAPVPYAAALSHPATYWLMELSLLASAVGFWGAVLRAGPNPALLSVALAGFMAQMGLLGALLAFAPAPLYAPHLATTAPWGLTPLADQQLAGLVMWVPGMLPYLVALVAGVGLWYVRAVEAGQR